MAKAKTPVGKQAAPLAVIDVAPIKTEDEIFVEQVGTSVREFLKSLAGFFLTARSIEQGAQRTLTTARALVQPTSQLEDDRIIAFVRSTTAERKQAEDHWQIAQVVHRFHKRLTAARDRATSPLEEAGLIGNRLHNAYNAQEQRRVSEEQARLQREAETRARQEREAETARMEAEALRLEEQSADLSEREEMFVNYILQNFPPHVAATRSGYSKANNGDTAAQRLMGMVKIQKAIHARRQAATIREQKQAVAEAPLDVQVETVKANVTTAGRTTWGGEGVDLHAALEAWRSGKYGIPENAFRFNDPVVNELGRSLHEGLDRIPGFRHTKKTGVV